MFFTHVAAAALLGVFCGKTLGVLEYFCTNVDSRGAVLPNQSYHRRVPVKSRLSVLRGKRKYPGA